ncbi:quinone oxidoreductase [Paenalcaligenes niemegkensis]|uniref:quinone oxidoreductase family protein n=1 Tax=Paenalcaligenes niemegkensis TaxID=2895469 RepID=UPI001EE84BD2|nr:quinone oxidoreductase [Paenalcaligenes niemegkensis]MCQ9616828.1 quinone oxidoreductase [Paenalcaligenes niemegkensis]
MQQSVKAIRIEENGGPEVMQWLSIPLEAPKPNEVCVRHKVIGLNFIDIYFRDGLYPSPLPHGLGFEASGVVEAVGADVHHVKVGDRVAYGQGPLGAYSEARNIPGDRVVKLPDEISFEEAAVIMLKGLTVQYLFRQVHELKAGETILFHAAAGGVGSIACQWAKALGVKLIGTVSSPEKAAAAKANGAWEVINYSNENVIDRVRDLTDGRMVPVVYDGVGKATWETSLKCLQPRGLMVSFGNASGAVTDVNLGILAQHGSLYVTRPSLAAFVPTLETMQAAAEEVFELVKTGKIKVEIGQRYALKDAARAHEELASRKTVGASVLTVD